MVVVKGIPGDTDVPDGLYVCWGDSVPGGVECHGGSVLEDFRVVFLKGKAQTDGIQDLFHGVLGTDPWVGFMS